MVTNFVSALFWLLIGLSVALPTTTTRRDVSAVSLPSMTYLTPHRSRPNTATPCSTFLRAKCICHDTNARVFIDCTGLTLYDLLDLKLDDAVWLRISDSRFPTLGPLAVRTLSVEGLQIDSSNISQVHRQAFFKMGHLKSLMLQDNSLTDIPMEAVRYLHALEMMSLAGNYIEKVPINTFTVMPNLYYISLSQNRIRSIEAGCFGSTVRQLALSSNLLTSLNNSVLFLPRLEWLLMTENRLSTLKGQLDNLHSLTHLHVADNSLTNISDTFGHLQHLQILNLSRNAISKVGQSDLEGLTSLNTLDLSGNNISDVEATAFVHLKHLAFFDISNNSLVNVDRILESITRSLTNLFLSGNQLGSFDVTLPQLRSLDLARNRLTSIFNIIGEDVGNRKQFTKLEHLTLSDNRLESLNDNFRYLTPSLVHLHLDRNRLTRMDTPVGGDSGSWKRLKELSLSSNAIESVSASAMRGLVRLKKLDLSRNRISRLEPKCFTHLSALRNLDISYNRLEYLDSQLLDGLHKLRTLSLANNHITRAHQMTFEGLTKLDHLDLSRNRLVSIRDVLLPFGVALDISFNPLIDVNGTKLGFKKEN